MPLLGFTGISKGFVADEFQNGLDLCVVRRVNILLTSFSTPTVMHKLYLAHLVLWCEVARR